MDEIEKPRVTQPLAAPKPKKQKPVKLTKSKAAELKDSLEKNQISKGDPEPKVTISRVNGDGTKTLLATGNATTILKKAAKKLKPKQEQLMMPVVKKMKLDAIGKAAKRFKSALEQLELAQDEKGAASENLLKAMKKAKRLRATFDGYHFECIHQGPKDTVKVQKPK